MVFSIHAYFTVCLSCITVCSTKHAYILYTTEHAATAAYESAKSSPPHLDDRKLIVRRYEKLPESGLPLLSYAHNTHSRNWRH